MPLFAFSLANKAKTKGEIKVQGIASPWFSFVSGQGFSRD